MEQDLRFATGLAGFAFGVLLGILIATLAIGAFAPIVVKVPVNAIPLQKLDPDMTEACTAWWTGSTDLTAVRSRLCGVKK